MNSNVIVDGYRFARTETPPAGFRELLCRAQLPPQLEVATAREVRFTVRPPTQQIGGSCYAFGAQNALRYSRPASPVVSAAFVDMMARFIDGGGDDANGRAYAIAALGGAGSWARSVAAGIQWFGAPRETDWPSAAWYRDRAAARQAGRLLESVDRLWPSQQARLAAHDGRMREHDFVRLDGLDAAETWLHRWAASGLEAPVELGCMTFSEVNRADIKVLEGTGTALGGHIWTLLGVRRDELGRRWWLAQTTWGAWGPHRNGTIEVEDQYLRAQWDELIGYVPAGAA